VIEIVDDPGVLARPDLDPQTLNSPFGVADLVFPFTDRQHLRVTTHEHSVLTNRAAAVQTGHRPGE
jgi:hypothetical protein